MRDSILGYFPVKITHKAIIGYKISNPMHTYFIILRVFSLAIWENLYKGEELKKRIIDNSIPDINPPI